MTENKSVRWKEEEDRGPVLLRQIGVENRPEHEQGDLGEETTKDTHNNPRVIGPLTLVETLQNDLLEAKMERDALVGNLEEAERIEEQNERLEIENKSLAKKAEALKLDNESLAARNREMTAEAVRMIQRNKKEKQALQHQILKMTEKLVEKHEMIVDVARRKGNCQQCINSLIRNTQSKPSASAPKRTEKRKRLLDLGSNETHLSKGQHSRAPNISHSPTQGRKPTRDCIVSEDSNNEDQSDHHCSYDDNNNVETQLEENQPAGFPNETSAISEYERGLALGLLDLPAVLETSQPKRKKPKIVHQHSSQPVWRLPRKTNNTDSNNETEDAQQLHGLAASFGGNSDATVAAAAEFCEPERNNFYRESNEELKERRRRQRQQRRDRIEKQKSGQGDRIEKLMSRQGIKITDYLFVDGNNDIAKSNPGNISFDQKLRSVYPRYQMAGENVNRKECRDRRRHIKDELITTFDGKFWYGKTKDDGGGGDYGMYDWRMLDHDEVHKKISKKFRNWTARLNF